MNRCPGDAIAKQAVGFVQLQLSPLDVPHEVVFDYFDHESA